MQHAGRGDASSGREVVIAGWHTQTIRINMRMQVDMRIQVDMCVCKWACTCECMCKRACICKRTWSSSLELSP